MGFAQGTHNVFAAGFSNQCTYWAAQRYHTLTGIWTPCTGNAYQWLGQSKAAGWQTASQPPKGVPSIIFLQGYAGQGVESQYGHVAIVERVNVDGSVYTSDYNWSPNLGNSIVTYVTFRPGSGVSFIWADNSAGSIPVVSRLLNTVTQTASSATNTFSLASNASIAQALSSFDNALALSNPFNVQAQIDSFQVGGNVNVFGYNTGISTPSVGISFTDPVAWLVGFGNNLLGDLVALVWRAILIVLGVFLLYRVLDHYVNFEGMAQQATNNVSGIMTAIGPLLAA